MKSTEVGLSMTPAGPWVRQGTPAVDGAIAISLIAIPLGLVSGRPDLVVLAAPLFVAALTALTASHPPQVEVGLAVNAERVIEGDRAEIVVQITSTDRATVIVELKVSDPSGVRHVRAGAAVDPDVAAEVVIEVGSDRWGAREITGTAVTVDRLMGVVRHRRNLAGSVQQRILPTPQKLRQVLAPRRTRPTSGNLPSRAVGGGIEFAGTRPYRTGDDSRWINWRSSARRGDLWVNEFHVERSADVVLFVDAFRDVSSSPASEDGTAVVAVRLAYALADAYLREHARVGAVSYGGNVRWLRLGMGRRQAFQIVETLLDAELTLRSRRIRAGAIPPRQIPRESLVIVVSPLLDHRILSAVAHLRARDHEVVVVDLGERYDDPVGTGTAELESRLLGLARRAARARLAKMGVPVATWNEDIPLGAALAELQRWRRRTGARR